MDHCQHTTITDFDHPSTACDLWSSKNLHSLGFQSFSVVTPHLRSNPPVQLHHPELILLEFCWLLKMLLFCWQTRQLLTCWLLEHLVDVFTYLLILLKNAIDLYLSWQNYSSLVPPGVNLPPLSTFRGNAVAAPPGLAYPGVTVDSSGQVAPSQRAAAGMSQTGDALGKALASVCRRRMYRHRIK